MSSLLKSTLNTRFLPVGGMRYLRSDAPLSLSEEEIKELKDEIETGDKNRMTEEFGDLMFALVNYSRFIKVNPMDALEVANKKFRSRFNYVEEKAREAGKSLVDMSLDEMNELWEEAKKNLRI